MKTTILGILCLTLLFGSCRLTMNEGSGPIVTKVYDMKFAGIEQDNGIESKVYQSEAHKIIVEAPTDIMADILVELKSNNIVHIHLKQNSNIALNKVKVSIYTPYVERLDASSAAEITVMDTFISDMITFETSSGAEISGSFKALHAQVRSSSGSSAKLHFEGKAINAQSTSGSSVKLVGLTKTCQFKASSGSEIDAKKLTSLDADAESSSGGEIELTSIQKANAKASSGSSIKIHKQGNQFEVRKQETSGGVVSID